MKLLYGWVACCKVAVILSSNAALAAPPSNDSSSYEPTIPVHRVESGQDVAIDGILNEPIWDLVQVHDDFVVTSPETLDPAPLKTRVRMFCDNRGLYVSADMQQDPESLIERLSAPDQGFLTRDYFMLALDTSGEGRYGNWFQLNLGGSRADGTVQPERQFSSNWDGAWRGATARTEDGWSAEFFIPWSIVSMPQSDGVRRMGVYASRKVAYTDARFAWPGLTSSSSKFLSRFQPITLERVNPRQQLSFFPYAASAHRQIVDIAEDQNNYNVGADVFWRPSTNFQVTASLNPDFGTVESDDVVINLTAFETFFPEKRLFFLEGQEIFVPTARASSWSSNPSVMLLHTRRIGQPPVFPLLPKDASFDLFQFRQPSDLMGAVKLTGHAGSVRYGILTATESDSRFLGLGMDGDEVSVSQSGRNFGVGRVLWERSNGDYRAIGLLATALSHPHIDANSQGVDFHYGNESGQLRIDGQLLRSDSRGQVGKGGFVDINYYQGRRMSHEIVVESFDRSLDLNDMGYLGRNDQTAFRYRFRMRQQEWSRVREASTRVAVGSGWNSAGEVTTRGASVSWELKFHNLTQFRIQAEYRPEVIDDRNSYGNGSFTLSSRKDIGIRYQSNSSKRFYYIFRSGWSSDYADGNRYSASSSVIFRPSDRFSSFVNIGFNSRDGWLLFRGNRKFVVYSSDFWTPQLGINFFLSTSQHLRFDMQWSAVKAHAHTVLHLPETGTRLRELETTVSQSDDFAISRLNLQFRYHWSMAPMSDLFLVYTRNASLPNPINQNFVQIFEDTLHRPTSEQIAFKIRHHLGVN
ncbi:MAG: DUF5916 domain-containing protein [Gammaproteobacteria bacterium]|nr:DUF5916 domain-containing protein [Gammaproteobacteria bacterium]